MAFSSKTLQTLEFNKIIDMLAAATSTEGAKARAMSLTPSSDYDEIIMRQNKTDDAKPYREFAFAEKPEKINIQYLRNPYALVYGKIGESIQQVMLTNAKKHIIINQ